MKTTTAILMAALVAACSSSRTAPEPPADRNEGLAEAQAAIAGVKNDVLEQRVHALEVEMAELQNSARATNTDIFDQRLKAVEAKVYAGPGPASPPSSREAPAANRKASAADTPRIVNPYATYRPLTPAEREAVDRLARTAPTR